MSGPIYNSYTHGRISMSHVGKDLMKQLRDAITEAISKRSYGANQNAVANARGDLAQYISGLEKAVADQQETISYFGAKPWRVPKSIVVLGVDTVNEPRGTTYALEVLRTHECVPGVQTVEVRMPKLFAFSGTSETGTMSGGAGNFHNLHRSDYERWSKCPGSESKLRKMELGDIDFDKAERIKLEELMQRTWEKLNAGLYYAPNFIESTPIRIRDLRLVYPSLHWHTPRNTWRLEKRIVRKDPGTIEWSEPMDPLSWTPLRERQEMAVHAAKRMLAVEPFGRQKLFRILDSYGADKVSQVPHDKLTAFTQDVRDWLTMRGYRV